MFKTIISTIRQISTNHEISINKKKLYYRGGTEEHKSVL